jgi:hypothetical protein
VSARSSARSLLIPTPYAGARTGYRADVPFAEESRLRRPARVVRVAPLDIRRDRLQDLQRIFDGPVHVIAISSSDPTLVHAAALSTAADAIVIDVVAPLQLAAVIGGLRSHVLLRPTFDQLRTSRGELQPVFVGYAHLSADGSWTLLDDGALTIDERVAPTALGTPAGV